MRILFALALFATCTWAQESADALYQQALALEREGKGAEAVQLYSRAARAGNADAAKRLKEIFLRTGASPRQPLIGDFPTKRERERDWPPPQK